MATQRSTIILAVRAALNAAGKPDGLVVTSRRSMPREENQLPETMVGRSKETTTRASNNSKSPVVSRSLEVKLDHWASGDDPEEALEAQLAWATAVMCGDPGWNGLAIETTEDSTEWDVDMLDLGMGRATQTFTIRFSTKTIDQESKQ